jgi:hypothetical protein
LIVLALQDQVVLPAELVTWLESWAGLRLLHDAAIAVFDGGEGDTLSATATPVISEFARRQGLSLILRDVHPSAARSATSGLEPAERELPMLPVMHCDPDVPACSRYEVFGINE